MSINIDECAEWSVQMDATKGLKNFWSCYDLSVQASQQEDGQNGGIDIQRLFEK